MKHNTTIPSPIHVGLLFALLILYSSACSTSQQGQISVPCSPSGLVEAINDANADPDLTVLFLETQCTYEFIDHNNEDSSTGKNALPKITSAINIIGKDSSIIRGDVHEFRLFEVTSAGSLRLEFITINNGSAVSSGTEPFGGGAIANYGGVLTLENTVLENNFGSYGGAVFNSGSLLIDGNSIFQNNESQTGGAIYIASSAGIPISISNSIFDGNRADGADLGSGGAIFISETNGAGIGIMESSFENNSASSSGGAIYNADQETILHIFDVDFLQNRSGEDGGAIYLENGTLFLNLTGLHNNQAGESPGICSQNTSHNQRGGAIFVEQGTLEANFNAFRSNSAEYAGGILYNENGSVSFIDTSFWTGSTNDSQTSGCPSTTSSGGGIYNSGSLTLLNSSIMNCRSENGGGLMNQTPGHATLINVTLGGNIAVKSGGNLYTDSALDLNYVTVHLGEAIRGRSIFIGDGNTRVKDSIFDINSNVSDNSCVIELGSLSAFGENIDRTGSCPDFSILEDPELSLFGGGGFFTLSENSPALDKSDCITIHSTILDTDQRGLFRPPPADDRCDLGAIEMEAELLPPSPTPSFQPRLYSPKNLTCREGDSEDYPAAGYLLEGESADVIGQNREGTWLVINNPDWEGICWLSKGSVDLEGELDTTQVFTAPPLLPTPKPGGDGNNGSGPTCSGYISPADCTASGGSYNIANSPPCTCP